MSRIVLFVVNLINAFFVGVGAHYCAARLIKLESASSTEQLATIALSLVMMIPIILIVSWQMARKD